MSLEKKTIELLYKELQKHNQTPDTSSEENYSTAKRLSTNDIALQKKQPPLSVQIIMQLLMWAFDNDKNFAVINLADIVNILSEAKDEKGIQHKTILIEQIFDTFHPSDLDKIIHELLRQETVKAINSKDMNTYMRGNTFLSAFLRKQGEKIIFAQEFIDRLPNEIKQYQQVYNKTSKDTDNFEVSLISNHYKIILGNYLLTLTDRLKELPDTIKRNCYLIAKNFSENNQDESLVLNKIGGYLFLRLIHPGLDNYVKSDPFKQSVQPKKTFRLSFMKDKTPTNQDDSISKLCANVVKLGIIYPVQVMSNFLKNPAASDNNNTEENVLEKKNERLQKAGSDWKKQGVEIANGFSDDVAACFKEIITQEYKPKEIKTENYTKKYYSTEVRSHAIKIVNTYLNPHSTTYFQKKNQLIESEKSSNGNRKEVANVLSSSLPVIFMNGSNNVEAVQIKHEKAVIEHNFEQSNFKITAN